MTPSMKYEQVSGVHKIVPVYQQNHQRMIYGYSELSWMALNGSLKSMKRAILVNIEFNRQSRPLKGI